VPGVVLCLLAIAYSIGFVVNYVHVGYVNDWLIYRLAGITAFAAAGVSLLLTGVLAERLVALLNGRERHHGGPTRLLQRVTRPSVALISAALLLFCGLYANRHTLVQYVSTGHVYVHWSVVLFGLFAVVIAFNLISFAALDFLVSLFPEQVSRLRRTGGRCHDEPGR